MRQIGPFDPLIAYLQRRSATVRHGCIPKVLESFEANSQISLPADLRAAYLVMDGMDEPTDTDAGWTRFLPLAEWVPARIEIESLGSSFSDSVVIADHAYAAWFFAIDLGKSPSRGRIHCVGAGAPYPLADSFSELVHKVLADAPELYGASA